MAEVSGLRVGFVRVIWRRDGHSPHGIHGTSEWVFLSVGLSAPGTGDRPLHSAAAGHVLDLGDSVPGADWGAGVHLCGSAAGSWFASQRCTPAPQSAPGTESPK